MANRLSPTMTLAAFENGYWYLDDLKDFAKRIGIPLATRLRKDEIERAIVVFLRTGTVTLPTKRALRKTGTKDLARGLSLKLRIVHYTSNRETKDFIVREARRMAPEVRERSGVWYRLNRWREERMERFDKIPIARYNNFVAEFLAAEKGGIRSDAIAAWMELKTMNVPKNYVSWAKARQKRGKRSGNG
jgi:hypothetical protein